MSAGKCGRLQEERGKDMSKDKYESPLCERYASKEMQYIFSPDMKFKTWRKLWIALAETEKELGLKDENGNPRITSRSSRLMLMTSTMMLPEREKSWFVTT